jgi:hypothetical protein
MTEYRVFGGVGVFGGVLFERPQGGVFWMPSESKRRAEEAGARVGRPSEGLRCECGSRTFCIIHTDHYEVSGECARCGRRDVVASG